MICRVRGDRVQGCKISGSGSGSSGLRGVLALESLHA